MSTNKCIVLVPVGSHIEPECERGLARLEARGYVVRRVSGYAAIDQGRSQMATDALAEGFEELMWIDSDVDFDPDSVDRLRAHDLPIVCGIYPKKGVRALSCHLAPNTPQVVFGTGGGLLEITYAATGFLHTRRVLYETMRERLDLPICNESFARPIVPYFLPMIVSRDGKPWYLGEDFSFCERAKKCDYAIMADTTFRLRHIGRYGYTWEDAGALPTRYAHYTFNVTGRFMAAITSTPSIETRIAFDCCPLCGCEDALGLKAADCREHPLYNPALPPSILWIECDGCKHVFTEGYFGERALEILFRAVQPSQTPGANVAHARGVAAKIVEDVARFRDRLDGRWLDVGFGDGSLLTTAAEFGYEVVGLDLRAESAAKMRALGFEAHSIELTELESAAPFDVVSMADVLEHMPFPKAALAKAHTLLANDGLLFVSMPNTEAFAWKDLDARGVNPYWAEIEHLHNFSRTRLYALLEELGFSPCRYGISQRYLACMEVVARKRPR